MTRWIRRPSPAIVVACLSLAVSLSSAGYAATVLPKNSVGTAQLKKNAVVSTKVKDRTLLAADFKVGQLPAGPPGPKGDKGDRGDKGDKGDTGAPGVSDHQIVTALSPADSSALKVLTVSCPSGKKLLGGGAITSPGGGSSAWVYYGYPSNDRTWNAGGTETPGYVGPWTLRAFAICARVS